MPAKPVPTIEILTSAEASALHNNAVEKRGDALADQVRRLCVWAKDMGMPGAPC